MFNNETLNKGFDVVAVDIVRGSGFNINSNSTKVTYELISEDLQIFIEKFLLDQNMVPSLVDVIVYAGFELAIPAILYTNRIIQEKENSITKKGLYPNKNLLFLENPWLGYSSVSTLNVKLPSYGVTDRTTLDYISNTIYSLQSSDYGKDTKQMEESISKIQNILFTNGLIDPRNPNMD